ncbi:hypothetical protein SRHO_G00300360 [Serrasalmus rhombeus]
MDSSKKRKVDSENRQFSSVWTDEFCFILPDRANAKPTCLLCSQTVAVCKVANIKRHKDVSVTEFWINMIPQFSQARQIAMLLLTAFPSTYICLLFLPAAVTSLIECDQDPPWTLTEQIDVAGVGLRPKGSCSTVASLEIVRIPVLSLAACQPPLPPTHG